MDALDQLGTVESPVAERQTINFQKPVLNIDITEEDVDQKNAFDKSEIHCTENVDRQELRNVLDCDEVRIMIKVLGPKVCFFFIISYYIIHLCALFLL